MWCCKRVNREPSPTAGMHRVVDKSRQVAAVGDVSDQKNKNPRELVVSPIDRSQLSASPVWSEDSCEFFSFIAASAGPDLRASTISSGRASESPPVLSPSGWFDDWTTGEGFIRSQSYIHAVSRVTPQSPRVDEIPLGSNKLGYTHRSYDVLVQENSLDTQDLPLSPVSDSRKVSLVSLEITQVDTV